MIQSFSLLIYQSIGHLVRWPQEGTICMERFIWSGPAECVGVNEHAKREGGIKLQWPSPELILDKEPGSIKCRK